MRILFISAFYPPYVIGGWEQLVHDVNLGLQARGHTTSVLTSIHGVSSGVCEAGVARLLTLESDLYHYRPSQFIGHKGRLKKNLEHTKRVIDEFRPDIVFVHGMWNLSRGIPWLAEQLCAERVVYYVANDWPYATDLHTSYWQESARDPLRNLGKKLVGFIPLRMMERERKDFNLQFQHVLCVSHALKNELARHAQISEERMRVVYNGVELDRFVFDSADADRRDEGETLSLLYAGSLVWHKGVHTAIQALALLARQPHRKKITLTILGSGHPDYEAYLRSLVDGAGLGEVVCFMGRIPREEMPSVLRRFHVLVFPSTWEEPLARMTQEAMASGLIVVGTLTGGTGELLIEGETGLTFEPSNAVMLAQRIEQLYDDPELCVRLAKNGREKVVRDFDLCRMIDEIDQYFAMVVSHRSMGNS